MRWAGVVLQAILLALGPALVLPTHALAAVGNADVRIAPPGAQSPVAGETFGVTYQVSNLGPDAATNVVVTFTVPAHLSLAASQPSATTCVGTTCTLGTINAGATVFPSGVFFHADSAGDATINWSVSADQADANTANNTGSTSVHVLTTAVGVAASGPASALKNTPFDLTFVVTNAGPGSALNTHFQNTLPNAMHYVSSTTSQGSCTTQTVLDPRSNGNVATTDVNCALGTLANAGSTATLTIRVTVGISATVTDSYIWVSAADARFPTFSPNLPVDVGFVDLAVTQAISSSSIHVGDTFTDTITVTNNGPDVASALYLTSSFDTSRMTFVSAAPSAGTCTFSNAYPTGLSCQPPGTLASGATYSVVLTLRAISPASFTSIDGRISSNDHDTSTYNNLSTQYLTITVPTTVTIGDVSVNEGDTGTTALVFTVTLSSSSDQVVTVGFSTQDGTATAGSDYAASTGALTFSPGQTSKTITIQVNGDLIDEADETFFVNLTNPVNATIAKGQGLGTIVNDDLPTISINDVSVTEGNTGTTNATFTVSLSNPSTSMVTVDYSTADATAKAGSDYVGNIGTLTFAPGITTQTITVVVISDLLNEADETFFVNLSKPANATIGDGQGLATILNDDALPTILTFDIEVSEGGGASFEVKLSAPSGQVVIVRFSTSDGTAMAGSDYEPTTGMVVFPEGVTTQTITVRTIDDVINEDNETFFVNLTNPTNAMLARGKATGTIIDNDDAPSISINDVSVTEMGPGQFPTATFTVSLSAPSGQTVSVDFSTSDGPAAKGARAGSDYIVNAGTVIFPPGSTAQTIVIVVIGDDVNEPDETFFVDLSKPTNALIAGGRGVATILNDDAVPSISINDVTVIEGNAGVVSAIFTVSLSNPSQDIITVDYTTADGTARAGSDYLASIGSVAFAPGTTTQTITVLVNGDLLNEADEIFAVNLTSPVNATIGDAQGIGTIANDDPQPRLFIMDTSATEGTSVPLTATVEVRLSAPSGQIIVVNFATADGTARSGSGGPNTDYVANAGTLVFNPGETTKTVTISLENDTLREDNETFFVDLRNPTNATIDKGRAVVTILDDDNDPVLSIAGASALEGPSGTTHALVFTVTLTPASGQTVTGSVATKDGSAQAGSDYDAAAGTLTFLPGETTKNITVNVKGDSFIEADETFLVNLSNPINAIIGDGTGVGTIVNDDFPTISISDVTMKEGNAGTTDFDFVVQLSDPLGQVVTVDFATTNGTTRPALAGSDYVANSGKLVFQPLETTKTITVKVIGDDTNEVDETFFVKLSAPVNATLPQGTASGLGTILNDDPLPSISINDVTVNEGDTGTTDAVFVVTLSNPSSQVITVDYATANGTTNPALAGSDYVAATGTLSFLPGEATRTIVVRVIGDLFWELNETFFVNLSNPTSATFATVPARGRGTILDNDTRSLSDQIADLRRLVQSFGLAKGLENSLLAKLRAECGPLHALVNQVASEHDGDQQGQNGQQDDGSVNGPDDGRGLTTAQASALLRGVTQLLIDAGCTDDRSPSITSFAPLVAPVGTVVTITGSNLGVATGVKFNGTDAGAITVSSPSSIKVNVPTGATSGQISVLTTTGSATSAAVFKVSPRVTAFAPTSGLPGTSVTILGTNFTGATSVKFGAASATFGSLTDTSVVATVPATAITGKIMVTTVDGTGISATDFIVVKPPTISSFTPASGPVGTTVAINGTNLSTVTDVKFNGVSVASIQVVSASSIKVSVPAGASTGKISVTNPAGTALSLANFSVLPRVDSFSPSSGIVGSTVTISGLNLKVGAAAPTVKIGVVVAPVISSTDVQVVVTVPPTAVTGKVFVTTVDGLGISANDFTVIKPPTITSFTPGSGVVGVAVTIIGPNVGSATDVKFNGTSAAAIQVISATQIKVNVPLGATTGKISVTNAAGTAMSAGTFTVLP